MNYGYALVLHDGTEAQAIDARPFPAIRAAYFAALRVFNEVAAQVNHGIVRANVRNEILQKQGQGEFSGDADEIVQSVVPPMVDRFDEREYLVFEGGEGGTGALLVHARAIVAISFMGPVETPEAVALPVATARRAAPRKSKGLPKKFVGNVKAR